MSKKASGSKQAAIVLGALAMGWLAIEIAFKPFLERVRSAIDDSDPARDPDDNQSEQRRQSDHDDDDQSITNA